jgi:hypothetical protein
MNTRFDRDYYRRFYFDSRTAVTSRAEMRARARLIGAYATTSGCRCGACSTPAVA